jgi:hypothetical protein
MADTGHGMRVGRKLHVFSLSTSKGRAKGALLPDAPGPTIAKGPKKPFLGRLFGFITKPAVAIAIAGALLVGAAAPARGQTLPEDHTIEFEVIGQPPGETPYTDLRLDALSRLDRMREQNRVSLEEYVRVRARLFESSVLGSELPRDHLGRVDLELLIANVDPTGKTRGQVVMERLLNRVEQQMRVTARDMANPETRFLEDAPGYKEISGAELRRLVTEALKDMPLDELPLGDDLARFLRSLPPGAGVQATMSFHEIEDRLEDATKVWLERTIGPLIEGREVEVGIVAFAAITGVRYASPELAGLMDGISPRITIFRATSEDDRLGVRARLAYRDAEVLPQLDLTATANTTVSLVDLYAEVSATGSIESRDHVQGRVTLGGRSRGENLWFDTSISQYLHEDRQRLNLTVGGNQGDLGYATSLTAIRGKGVARGNADGRVQLEVDVSKPVKVNGMTGSVGLYAGASADTDGNEEEVSAGVMLHLRW